MTHRGVALDTVFDENGTRRGITIQYHSIHCGSGGFRLWTIHCGHYSPVALYVSNYTEIAI